MLRVKSPQDLGAGLLFLFIGAVGLYFGKDLTYGSARSMGPGYFPIWLSWIIITMGVICVVRALTIEGEPIGAIPPKPIVWVGIGVLMFGYLIEHVKLELALILLTIFATQSRRPFDLAQKIVTLAALVFGFAIVVSNFGPLSGLKGIGAAIFGVAPWISLALLAVVAALVWNQKNERQNLILAVGMAFAAVLIFVNVLGQAMPTWSSDYFAAVFTKIGSLFKGA